MLASNTKTKQRHVPGKCAWLPILAVSLLAIGGCNSGGDGNSGTTPTRTPQLSLLAGSAVSTTIGTTSSSNSLNGISTDSAGNTYMADARNSIIRKISPTGVVTTLTGKQGVAGSTDGAIADARFNFPSDVATDTAGNIYVADQLNHTVRKITAGGVVSTLAGKAGVDGHFDAAGAEARFSQPRGIATDSAGNVYVADNYGVRKITLNGVVSTVTISSRPSDVVVDSSGNVFVSDTYKNSIDKVSPNGTVTTLAGGTTSPTLDMVDGTGADARFSTLFGMAIDAAGNIYAADGFNLAIRKITPTGVVTTPFHSDNPPDRRSGGVSFGPLGIGADTAGNLYVAEASTNLIRKISADGTKTTLASNVLIRTSADGTGTAASFLMPLGLAADSEGNIYVADFANSIIRKTTPAGVVSTLAGVEKIVGSLDGSGALTSFNRPIAVATDSSGNVYVADAKSNTVRKVSSVGVTTTLAGTAGTAGSADGTGSTARFNYPIAIATDKAGNVYVADMNNNAVRKITPAGVVSTLDASFNHPLGIAIDSGDNIYVVDKGNTLVHKIAATGSMSTLATISGSTWQEIDPLNSDTSVGVVEIVTFPVGISVDSNGNVYVADPGHSTILKVSGAGMVSTLAGVSGQAGFQPGALPGLLTHPSGLVVSGKTLYFSTPGGVAQITNLY